MEQSKFGPQEFVTEALKDFDKLDVSHTGKLSREALDLILSRPSPEDTEPMIAAVKIMDRNYDLLSHFEPDSLSKKEVGISKRDLLWVQDVIQGRDTFYSGLKADATVSTGTFTLFLPLLAPVIIPIGVHMYNKDKRERSMQVDSFLRDLGWQQVNQ